MEEEAGAYWYCFTAAPAFNCRKEAGYDEWFTVSVKASS